MDQVPLKTDSTYRSPACPGTSGYSQKQQRRSFRLHPSPDFPEKSLAELPFPSLATAAGEYTAFQHCDLSLSSLPVITSCLAISSACTPTNANTPSFGHMCCTPPLLDTCVVHYFYYHQMKITNNLANMTHL